MKKLALTSFIALLVLILPFVGGEATAQTAPNYGSGSSAGSVGSLVGAAMQTAGVYAQAKVLVTFKDGLRTLAALCYICAIIGGVFSYGLFGNYSKALYLLVGPPLFFFMVTVTGTVDGIDQQIGNRVDGSIADQKNFLKKYVNSADYSTAQVSRFFIVWDKLVSSVVQGVVEQIINATGKEDKRVKARERYFSWIINYTPQIPGYQKLVHQSLLGYCGKSFSKLWHARKHRVDSQNRSIQGNLDPEGEKYLKEWNEIKQKKELKLDPESILFAFGNDARSSDFYDKNKVSCDDVWNIVTRTTREQAELLLSDPKFYLEYAKDYNGVPYKDVKDDIEKTLTQQGHGTAVDILAGYILKNTMKDAWILGNYSNVTAKVQDNRESSTLVFNQAEMTSSYGGYMRLIHFAKAIPYIQGLVLYLLSISFPFFAVFLVMPGRARSFLIWMSLWVWAKSWDIGFALVSVARKLMWTFVRGGVDRYSPGNVYGGRVSAQVDYDWARPETILSVIFDNDPNATLNLYFTVIGILTVAVPILAAHFCLGATNMYGIFTMAIDQVGNKWATQRKKMAHRAMVASPTERFADESQGWARLVGMFEGIANLFNAKANGSNGVARKLEPGMGKKPPPAPPAPPK